MRIKVVGKDISKNRILERVLKREGFLIDSKSPEIIICQGGDGTFLYNERRYPGIPKLLLRGKSICRKCGRITRKEMLDRLKKGRFHVKEIHKLEARLGSRRFLCANDFVIRNRHPSRALRFSVYVNGERVGRMHIGDGIVVSTAFGSTGYFRSITRRSFDKGIGIAFNNTVDLAPHMVMEEHSVIRIRAERDSAHFSFDNEPRLYNLSSGQSVTIRKSKEKMRILLLQ